MEILMPKPNGELSAAQMINCTEQKRYSLNICPPNGLCQFIHYVFVDIVSIMVVKLQL